jgi:nicotinate phosphoribosyltransferase
MLETLGDPPPSPGLLTDLYHPDAAYVAWRRGRNGLTTFDLYTRRAPFAGAYLLVGGLESALTFVRAFRYAEGDLRYLRQVRDYDPDFVEVLRRVRFSGEILAMPEGSIAFPNEPLVRVTAPFVEAILIEAGLLQAVNLATLIATKAARITTAAAGRRVSEFAFRRAQAPLTVSRSAFIGGCASTSFVAAAERFRLPATGTIPHALVQLFDDEREAFLAVAETYNRYTVLLDTYDVHRAISTVIDVAQDVQSRLGHTLAAVRLDSGDLAADSRYVRRALDGAGLTETRVLASGDLDEFGIAELVADGAPIDGYGVGTSLGVGGGSLAHGVEGGALGGVYKEVAYVGEDGVEQPRIKLAGDKSTWPGRKEVYRIGNYERDVIQLAGEPRPAGGARLLKPVMYDGEVLPGSMPPLSEIWELAQQNLRALPDAAKALRPAADYPVQVSEALLALRRRAAAAAGGQLPDPDAPASPPAP